VKATVPSFAKLNLDLRVLHKRGDGYHEIRTIFQSISLKDTIGIEAHLKKRTQIDVSCSLNIPDNLVIRAAQAVLDYLRVSVWVRFVLRKRIPMGAGLGGGSSNAAAVLIALPALLGRPIPLIELIRLSESLGSDVPFFLLGGTAVGLGRGTELYPLPDMPSRHAVVVSTGVHVSTADAYKALGRSITLSGNAQRDSPILREFQTTAWAVGASGLSTVPFRNDFEEPVFDQHAELPIIIRKLSRWGAKPAQMTGSGSGIFGIFETATQAYAAAARFRAGTATPVRFVSRRQYKALWQRALGAAAKDSCFASGMLC
jgi:4-diphosphocytidyl-2-C-methyl-D-erythritol kinase